MIQAKDQSDFGKRLQQAREAAGLSRGELAQRMGLDASHIYRLETSARRPSREAALALAEALEVQNEAMNAWLEAAGYAPIPLLPRVRGAVRTRGRGRTPGAVAGPSPDWNVALWAQWLEAMGLKEATIAHLLQALETAGPQDRHAVTHAVATTFTRLIERLETPVHTAVIPAAGGQHRLFAPYVMQRLLLRAMHEAVESGISQLVLVLAPGMEEALYMPLVAALELAVVPPLTLRFCEQARADGLGDALLQAEAVVGNAPFAVLLPDDIVRERVGRTVFPRELRRMIEASQQLEHAHLVAVTRVPKSKMPHCGVVRVAVRELLPTIRPVLQLVEKPELTHPICRTPRAFGIVGRYVLHPSIFGPLRALRDQGQRPIHLTDALGHLRRAGEGVYACELGATRQDIGEVLEQASGLLRETSDSSSTS
jgi:UTP--glucose-1-phosphate uridylyltransferase